MKKYLLTKENVLNSIKALDLELNDEKKFVEHGVSVMLAGDDPENRSLSVFFYKGAYFNGRIAVDVNGTVTAADYAAWKAIEAVVELLIP